VHSLHTQHIVINASSTRKNKLVPDGAVAMAIYLLSKKLHTKIS